MKHLLILILITHLSLMNATGQSGGEFKKKLQEVHQSFFNGILTENYQLIDEILSEDVTLGFPDGNFTPKQDYINSLKNGNLFYDSSFHEFAQIRIYGNTGVINGKSNLTFRYKENGEWFKMHEKLSYTAVYVLNKSSIRMVSWQSNRPKTDLSEKVPK